MQGLLFTNDMVLIRETIEKLQEDIYRRIERNKYLKKQNYVRKIKKPRNSTTNTWAGHKLQLTT